MTVRCLLVAVLFTMVSLLKLSLLSTVRILVLWSLVSVGRVGSGNWVLVGVLGLESLLLLLTEGCMIRAPYFRTVDPLLEVGVNTVLLFVGVALTLVFACLSLS